MILFNANSGLCALNASNGSKAWSAGGGMTNGNLRTIRAFPFQDKVIWSSNFDMTRFDLATGKKIDDVHAGWGRPGDHSRPGYGCLAHTATANYILHSGAFIDKNDKSRRFFVHRGPCAVNPYPAYGAVYNIPTQCKCDYFINHHGAMSSDPIPQPVENGARLRTIASAPAPISSDWPEPGTWSTFLADAARSSSSSKNLSLSGNEVWKTNVVGPDASKGWLLGDRTSTDLSPGIISAPTVAEGKVFVSCVLQNAVVALDARTGAEVWRFLAGGSVDSPPTIYKGLCLFGCRNGRIYCVNASTGALVWDFLAAPVDQRIVLSGNVESRWPLFGTVTMFDGNAFVTAGRHPELGGGIYLWKLDPFTGAIEGSSVLRSNIVDLTVNQASLLYKPVLQQDILVSDGSLLRMSTTCIIDPITCSYASTRDNKPDFIGANPSLSTSGANCMWFAFYPAVWKADDPTIFKGNARVGWGPFKGEKFAQSGRRLFAVRAEKGEANREFLSCWDAQLPAPEVRYRYWAVTPPVMTPPIQRVRSILATPNTVVIGGPLQKSAGGFIIHLDPITGAVTKSTVMNQPVVENGMAAAYGRLFISVSDGTVRSLGVDDLTAPSAPTSLTASPMDHAMVHLSWGKAVDEQSGTLHGHIHKPRGSCARSCQVQPHY